MGGLPQIPFPVSKGTSWSYSKLEMKHCQDSALFCTHKGADWSNEP